jgi:hypothetical protein
LYPPFENSTTRIAIVERYVRRAVSVAVLLIGKHSAFQIKDFFVSTQRYVKRLPKNLHMVEKYHKNAKNIIKLPYSAQKVLLRALILTLF